MKKPAQKQGGVRVGAGAPKRKAPTIARRTLDALVGEFGEVLKSLSKK